MIVGAIHVTVNLPAWASTRVHSGIADGWLWLMHNCEPTKKDVCQGGSILEKEKAPCTVNYMGLHNNFIMVKIHLCQIILLESFDMITEWQFHSVSLYL